jgi:Uncharacterized protein conserved in bacteria
MKLVVSGADYAMTDSITDGCLKAIRDGILTDVGIMVNNDCTVRAVEEIKKYPHVSISMDINLVSGKPVSNPNDVLSLVNSEGRFLTSTERKEIGLQEQFNYEEVYLETENQIKKFIELFNKKPIVLNPHSFGTPNSFRAMKELAKKYEIMLSMELFQDSRIKIPDGWYPTPIMGPRGIYTIEQQANTNVIKAIIEDKEKLLNYNYVLMLTHCGYCDGELIDMSSYNVIRGKEVQALCSKEVRGWINANNVELINLGQLINEVY